jgi:putative endopeptidase
MKRLTIVIVTLALMSGLLILQSACTNRAVKKDVQSPALPAFDTGNIDDSVKPGDDFFLYANGNWIKNNPVPDDRVSIGSFRDVYDMNQDMIETLLQSAAQDSIADPASVKGQIGAYFHSGMDSIRIHSLGLEPLIQTQNNIIKTDTPENIVKTLSWYHRHFMFPAFNVSFYEDPKNTDLIIVHVGQSGLGLPEREYYVGASERLDDIRKEYITFLAQVFMAMGYDKIRSTEAASNVMTIETRFAQASMNIVDRKDPQKTYHKMTADSLKVLMPDMDWDLYTNELGLLYTGYYNVHQPEFLKEFNSMLTDVSSQAWYDYFAWNLFDRTVHYLPDSVNELHFNFFNRYLSGQQKMEPRLKRVLNNSNWVLGDMLAQLYVDTYFPPEAKIKMTELTDNLKTALHHRIEKVDWMTDDTREKALNKLSAMRIKIGYPDKWEDYSGLILSRDDYYGNILSILDYNFNIEKKKAGQAPDPDEWFMPAHIVNAYYSPLRNEVVFPAGILLPPFFNLYADDPVNYGGIGVVIGHEMTHGFDDHGRQYDEKGILNDWWSEKDAEQFEARSKALVKQYDQYVVIDTFRINGELTLGENIADLGGVNVAYDALQLAKQTNEYSKIDGFTPDQRFFLGFAQIWRSNMKDETLIRRVMEDEHSPAHFRVVGPLENVDAFYQAFKVQPGDTMYRPKHERIVIW